MNILKIIKELHYYWNINLNKWWGNLEISIRVIKSCNERCIFCSTDLDNKIIKFEELLIILNFFIKAYSHKYNLSFVFTWWEPTLYPNLYDAILFITNKWYMVKVETNAINFSKMEYLEKFKSFKWKILFFISFHAHTEELYNKITNSLFYNSSVKWIKNLLNTFGNDFIEINCVINNFNINFLKDYLVFINNNFYFDNKVQLAFSMLLANKQNYENFLVKYTDIIFFLNNLNNGNLKNKINISNEWWWYTHLPFCILSKLKSVNRNNILEYALPLDKDVGNNIMYKWEKCKKCDFDKYCVWISKKYYNKFWDNELFTYTKKKK